MTVPTNIRMNLNAPFPSLVTGSGPISVGKQNGIWQIGYSVSGFGQGDPTLAQLPTSAVVVWDPVAQTFSQVSLLNLLNFSRFMAGSVLANFNAVGDNVISLLLPMPRYRLAMLMISAASASLTTAQFGLFSAAGGGGIAIIPAGAAITVSSTNTNANNSIQMIQSTTVNTAFYNFNPLYFRVTTATAGAATATVTAWIDPLP